MKKVLLITPDFPPLTGGISTYLAAVFGGLPDERAIVVAPDCAGSPRGTAPANLRVVRCKSWPLVRKSILLSMLISSMRLARREDLEAVHCGHLHVALVGCVLRRIFGLPWATWVYGMELFHPRLVRFFRALLLASDLVVADSEYTKGLVTNMGVSTSRVKVIHPPVDASRFSPSVDPKNVLRKHGLEQKRVLLTVGRLASSEQYKGHDKVIQALPSIAERVKEVAYLVVGDGDDRLRLERLADRHQVRDRVVFAGSVSHELLPSYYAACSLFIMPGRVRSYGSTSKMEGFGIVFLEAAACGKPSIGGQSGGIPDAIVDGITGMLVDPLQEQAIADAVVRLLTDSELARRMGEEGRARVLKEFTADAATRKVESVTRELIGRK